MCGHINAGLKMKTIWSAELWIHSNRTSTAARVSQTCKQTVYITKYTSRVKNTKELHCDHSDQCKGQPRCTGWKQEEEVSHDMLQLGLSGLWRVCHYRHILQQWHISPMVLCVMTLSTVERSSSEMRVHKKQSGKMYDELTTNFCLVIEGFRRGRNVV
jgi:hypothetical protein